MTSLLNDEKCVKMLAVYARFCTQAYMGIYLVVWYLYRKRIKSSFLQRTNQRLLITTPKHCDVKAQLKSALSGPTVYMFKGVRVCGNTMHSMHHAHMHYPEDDNYKLIKMSNISGPFSGPPLLSQERIHVVNANLHSHLDLYVHPYPDNSPGGQFPTRFWS